MTPNKSPEEIFNKAVELSDPTEQAEYLEKVCAGDEKLRAEVDALLKWDREAGSFLDIPDDDPNVTLETSAMLESSGTVIGRYKLLEKIGEGGMATVYMAEQKQPIRRRVALKIIKLGMDTKSVIARFEAERQALAMMDHPNIAHVYDAGTTESGRPYFVMELVKGASITEFCDKNNLSTKERLELFICVCQAVQHAHQKGIIHRDIKPSNVMVTLHDGKPVPKVIDFGIAKAVNQQLTEKTVFTRYAQMIGTPEYMSPEQAEMSGLDVDIRTDVFSLGVLLYELLTGTTPFDPQYLLSKGYAEMQRIIWEEEPIRPSTKISTLGEALTDVAKHRRTSPELLCKLIRTDLDWIVMKTLEKDRNRRYDSVSELTADIRRHLNHEPVLAGRPSTLYKMKQFVRRRRGLVSAATTVAAVIMAGFIISSVLYFRAKQAGQEASAARDEARQHAEMLKAMIPFYDWDMIPLQESWGGICRDESIMSALMNASLHRNFSYTGPALFEASYHGALGMALQSIGRYKAAEKHLKRAMDIRKEENGEEHPVTLVSANNLASLYIKQSRYDEAERLLTRTLNVGRRVHGEKHRINQDTEHCLSGLLEHLLAQAEKQYARGEFEQAFLSSNREDKLRRDILHRESRPSSIALMAMSLYRLDRQKEAILALDRLREFFINIEKPKERYETCLYKTELLLSNEGSVLHSVWHAISAGELDQAKQLVQSLHVTSDIQVQKDTAIAALARAYYRRGQRSDLRGDTYTRIISDYESALHLKPDYAPALRYLARIHATCLEEEFRDGDKAVKEATQACELTGWNKYGYIDTLAAANAEAGDFTTAVKWQKKAIELLPEKERSKFQSEMNSKIELYEAGKPFRKKPNVGMVAWWKLDELQGCRATDSSGNNHEGQLTGDATWAPGYIGGAAFFDGEGDYVDCGYSSDFDITEEITVAAWIRINAFDGLWDPIVTKGENSWRLIQFIGSNCLEFSCTGVEFEDKGIGIVIGKTNVNDGAWHHVAGVYDGVEMRLYVDGKLDNYGLASGTIAVDGAPLYIGGNSEKPNRYWDGLIDDVRVYCYALNEAEINVLRAGK